LFHYFAGFVKTETVNKAMTPVSFLVKNPLTLMGAVFGIGLFGGYECKHLYQVSQQMNVISAQLHDCVPAKERLSLQNQWGELARQQKGLQEMAVLSSVGGLAAAGGVRQLLRRAGKDGNNRAER
jgi:hypothetical protein